jgi:CheY-like chemotaxis protein
MALNRLRPWKRTSIFDLVQMPTMDGVEATALIRRKETNTGLDVPTIAMTAHAMADDEQRFLAI